MRNPYKIEGPALISFSGGRTSGFMLKQIVDAHDGVLPEDVHVTFAKTGKPKDPSIKYRTTDKVANLYPKTIPRNITTKVCIVAGTRVNGVCILDEIANKADPITTNKVDLIILEE